MKDVQDKEPCGEESPFNSAQAGECEAYENPEQDDGDDVVDHRPLGLGHEVLSQDVVDYGGVNLHARIEGAERGAPQVMGPHGRSPNQDDLILEGALGDV